MVFRTTFLLCEDTNEDNHPAVDTDAARRGARRWECCFGGGLILLESVASMIKLDGQFKMVPGRLRDAVAFGYFDEAINKTGRNRPFPLSPRLELPLHPLER